MGESLNGRMDRAVRGDTCLYLEVIDVEAGSETGWMDRSSGISVDNVET